MEKAEYLKYLEEQATDRLRRIMYVKSLKSGVRPQILDSVSNWKFLPRYPNRLKDYIQIWRTRNPDAFKLDKKGRGFPQYGSRMLFFGEGRFRINGFSESVLQAILALGVEQQRIREIINIKSRDDSSVPEGYRSRQFEEYEYQAPLLLTEECARIVEG